MESVSCWFWGAKFGNLCGWLVEAVQQQRGHENEV